MRLHRFVVGTDLAPGRVQITDSDLVHQWATVLRLQKGDALVLCDGKGSEANAVIDDLAKNSATVTISDVRTVESEPKRRVTLCAAILKRENFEWIVEKATEAGVSEIIPIISDRTMKTGLKMERLRVIAKEAVEQCGRGVLPVIREPMEFGRAMEEKKNSESIFFHVDSCHAERSRGTTTAPFDYAQGDIILWIGPEGGWTDSEVDIARSSGAEVRSLGTLTLRAETAAVIATYLAVNDLL